MDTLQLMANFDSALQNLVLDDPQQWSPVRLWLDLLETFLTFTQVWGSGGSASDGAREHLIDLPKRLETEFKNVKEKQDFVDAFKKSDKAKLGALRSRLLELIEIHKPEIGDAYEFLSGYVFQNNTFSDSLLSQQQWFPSYASLLGNCECLKLHSPSFFGASPLYEEVESVLKFLGKLQLPQIMFRDRDFRELCVQHGGVAICLSGLLFSCYANSTTKEADLWDLVLKIKPSSPRLLELYLEAIKSQIQSLQEKLVVELVEIILKPNPPAETESLVFLIRHLVDSDVEDDGEIGRILCTAASDPGSVRRLLQEAELLRTKMLLTELGDRESIRERPRFDDAYSENMMQILEEIETLMISGAEADPYVKVSLDSYIAVFQAFLMEVMSRSSVLILDVKGHIQKLSKESKRFRRYSLILPLKNPVVSNLMEVATRKAENLHEFFQLTENVEDKMSDLSRMLSEFLEQLRNLNEKVEEVYLRFRDSSMVSFPKTLPGLSFVDSFLERLRGIAGKKFPDGYCIKSQIEEGWRNSLAKVLKKVGEKQNGNQELIDLKRRVTRAAYEADYVIDSILALDADKCHLLWLSDAVNEMNLVKADLMKFCGEKNHLVQVIGAAKALDAEESAQSHHTPEVGEYIVPLDAQVHAVIGLLTEGESDKFVVGIVGTPGIGKTTLARMVYDHPDARDHFEKRSWCTISQEFRMRDVFLKILQDIDFKSLEKLQESDDEVVLRNILVKDLQGKRYLIVMDDIWSEEAWINLKRGLPQKEDHGGRILFTSREKTVLSDSAKNVVVYPSNPLGPKESWNLLERRVFGENLKCPEGLRIIGQEIASSCKGLPLSVVAVSGVLRKKEREPHVWNEIKQRLSSNILESPEFQCNRILDLSYTHLPDYLKPCLLYFAAFREDQEIQVNRLLRLWISEGLIRLVENVGDDDNVKALEDVAMEYLEDLSSRSLIMASRRSGSTNKMKVCKIHDLLYSLCFKKAENDNFFDSITKYAQLYQQNTEDHGLDIKPKDGTSPPSYINKHRLGIFSKRNQFVNLQPAGPPVRTLLFSATTDTRPTCPYDVSFIPRNFKILKVLDIESINMDSTFPEKILDLDPLRYLAVGGDITSVPDTINRLWNLESFTVRGLKGRVKLPDTIWTLSKLRHLHVYPGLTLDFGDDDDRRLHNLMTLSSPAVSQWADLKAIVRKAPQLRKLKCTFAPSDGHSAECVEFGDFPVKLESLKVIYSTGDPAKPWGLSFPSHLNKLSLKSFSLTSKCISSIGNLPKLQVLTLVAISFRDSRWKIEEDEFLELRTLRLDTLELRDWVVSTAFDQLERLTVRNCKNLRELPPAFAESDTLAEIELVQCSAITDASLKGILQDREDYSGNSLAITANGIKIT